jgi:cyclopropane fatty-acyl-phospholipid synthase-like methyltransferase
MPTISKENDTLSSKSSGKGQISNLNNMYGEDDLSSWGLFGGNFINFGYYPDGSIKPEEVMTLSERISSQKKLYEVVGERLNISSRDFVIEIGSGLGTGGCYLVENFAPSSFLGIDISQEQVDRSKNLNGEFLKRNKNILFKVGSCENIPCEQNEVDKIFTVEAVQHFPSLQSFIQESFRVLKPRGLITIAGFFGVDSQSQKKMAQQLETVNKEIDHLRDINQLRKILDSVGFLDIEIESIGKNVWEGFDKWISQQKDFCNTWNRNWLKGYNSGLIDYYIVTARKR